MDGNISKLLDFLIQCDKMKNIQRRTLIADGSRCETDAEHSWHLALMAVALSDYAPPKTNIDHAVRLALAHDLVEIYAGDTFCYDVQANEDKTEREQKAAEKLFKLLPKTKGEELRAYWDEFEACLTPAAQYVNALDRLQPFINNCLTNGHTWQEGNVRLSQVLQRMRPVQLYLPAFWPFVEEKLEWAKANKLLSED